jgi:hypothetical protein
MKKLEAEARKVEIEKSEDSTKKNANSYNVYNIDKFPLFAVDEKDYKIKILAHTFD